MRLPAIGQALPVARPVAGHNLAEFLPVDLAEGVVACLGIQAQRRVRDGDAEEFGLRRHGVHEALAQVVVAEALDFPGHAGVGVLALAVRRAEHHHRGPPPAGQRVLCHGLLRLGAAAQGHHDLVALALVEAFFLAHAHHGAGVGAVAAAAQRDLVHDRRTIHQPADGADIGPGQRGIVEDAAVFGAAGQELVQQLLPRHAQGFRGRVQV